MFELELMTLINKTKNSNEIYEKNQIKTSISNLIKQNPDNYEKFIQFEPLDDATKEILQICEQEIQEIENKKHQETINTQDDFNIIKNYYMKWLEIYESNNNQVNDENKKIVNDIIEHYVTHRYETLEKIFNLNDSQEYDKFKWHIKNELRIYYINKIREYLKSNTYKNLSFVQKIQKKFRIELTIKKIANYEFNNKKITEVLN